MQVPSFWWTTREYTPSPALEGAHRADIAIIGGGFTGLSTAYHLKAIDPSIEVVLLEQEAIGYGASGRNGGFGMTLFGMNLSMTHLRFGTTRTRQAHEYMERAVDYLWTLIQTHKLSCEAEQPGFLRMATTPYYVKRIQHEIKLAERLGLEGIYWLEAAEAQERVQSKRFLGAWWEPRCVLVNPAQLAWEMKRLMEERGVKISERSPVQEVRKTPKGYEIKTPHTHIRVDKIAFATNAFSVYFPQLYAKQVPVYTYIVLTEPLSSEWVEHHWRGREGVEDARNLIHYFRLTADNRLLMGGGDIGKTYDARLNRDKDERIFNHLRQFVPQLFPSLQGVRYAHAWGGPVSVTADMAPALGYLGKDKTAVYSLGCIGHGVSMTQYNGWTLAELLLERKSERTEQFFVNRWVIPWPPEPLRFAIGSVIHKVLFWEDILHERGYFTW